RRPRHAPRGNRAAAARALGAHGLDYRPLPALGGFRKPRPDSPNTGWRNPSFRGYADYMATPAFASGLDELIRLGTASPTAFACTEAVPWRCHRSLIADALTVRGIEGRHLVHLGTPPAVHALTSVPRAAGPALAYP